MTTIFRRKRQGEAWETGTDEGAETTLIVDVTTDVDAFTGVHVFDLGGPAVASILLTLMARAGDGETFGEGDGEISGSSFAHSSSDGASIETLQIYGYNVAPDSRQLVAVNDESALFTVVTPRYLIVELDLDEAPDFNVYAGPNHPTMTFRIRVTY